MSGTAPGVTQDGCQVWWHPPGTWSSGRCWLPPSPGLPCFADTSHYAVSGATSPIPCCPIRLPVGVISIPMTPGSPFVRYPPFLILFSSKGLARTRLQREKKNNNQPPASCQLCLWPIAPVSCLTLIPQFIQLRAPGQTERLRNLPETSAFPKPHKQFPASIPAPAARLGMPVHLGGGGTGCHRGAPHHLTIFPLVGTAANTPLASQPAAPSRRWGMS